MSVVLVTPVGEAAGAGAAAAALACAASEPERAALLIALGDGRRLRPTPIATAGARALEERLVAHLPDVAVASRGCICRLNLPDDEEGIARLAAALPLARESAVVVHLPPELLQPALASSGIRPSGALLRADLAHNRPLTALVARDLIARGLRVSVLKRPLPRLAAGAAGLGALPHPLGIPLRLRERLIAAPP